MAFLSCVLIDWGGVAVMTLATVLAIYNTTLNISNTEL